MNNELLKKYQNQVDAVENDCFQFTCVCTTDSGDCCRCCCTLIACCKCIEACV